MIVHNTMKIGSPLLYLCLVILLYGCGVYKQESLKPSQQAEQPAVPVTEEPAIRQATPEEIEEYAMMHQISDLKKAEFYLTHPEYAKNNPYRPTNEDMAYYELKFFQKMRPDMTKMIEKQGFMKARNFAMSVDPDAVSIDDREARRVMDEILRKNDIVDQEFTKSLELYESGNTDEAIKHIQIAINLKSDSPTMLYNLGIMYMKKEKYPEAIQNFQSSLNLLKGTGYTNTNMLLHPEVFIGASINLGLIYIRLSMYNEAVDVLAKAVKFSPKDLDANWNLAVAYYSMGDLTNAIPQVRRCIDLDPNNAEMHNTIGLLYYNSEFYNSALEEFQIAAQINPREKQYSYNEGVVLERLGRQNEAIEAFGKASGFKDAGEMYRVYSDQTVANKAKELYNSGCAAMEANDIDKAIECFKGSLAINPNMAELHVNLGSCYKKKGDLQNQIYHLEEASRLKPYIPDIYYNLGLAYSDSGMYLNARYALEKAIEINPTFKDARFSLGMVLCKTASYGEASKQFEKCIELFPDWYEAHLNLGTCYIKLGDIQNSKAQFEKAVQLRPNSAEAHYSLGISYMKLHRYNEAKTSFQHALKFDPGHRLARSMLLELEGIGYK